MNDLLTYYQSFVPAANIVYKKDIAAEHAFVTDDYGSACSTKAPPYINDCNFDLAGAILAAALRPAQSAQQRHAGAAASASSTRPTYISGHGMATTGWIYVPQACAAGTPCRLHVVLHGCKQNTADVGQQYVRNTGYNRWADTNNIVMLYPQTSPAATNSCWDWWGYDNANYAKKSGPQMAAIKAMVDRVGGGTPPSPLPAPTGVLTSGATDTSMVIGWASVNGAAGYNVYRGGTKANASPVAGDQLHRHRPGARHHLQLDREGGRRQRRGEPAVGAGQRHHDRQRRRCASPSSNYAHTTAGRALSERLAMRWRTGPTRTWGCGTCSSTTTLKQTGPNYYVIGTCPDS